jgi:hypothetical protein
MLRIYGVIFFCRNLSTKKAAWLDASGFSIDLVTPDYSSRGRCVKFRLGLLVQYKETKDQTRLLAKAR